MRSGSPVDRSGLITSQLWPRSRERALLETLRLVAYLYDMPDDTLEALLRRGRVVAHAPDAVILHKGPVARSEPLHFYVVTDGRVSVRDGRRIIAKLLKADTFGEWGISHQRGFRVADVMADGRLRALAGGDVRYGGLYDLLGISWDYDSDRVMARFAVVRRERMVAW